MGNYLPMIYVLLITMEQIMHIFAYLRDHPRRSIYMHPGQSGLNVDQVISLKVDITPITTMISAIKDEIKKYETDNNPTFSSETKIEEIIGFFLQVSYFNLTTVHTFNLGQSLSGIPYTWSLPSSTNGKIVGGLRSRRTTCWTK